MSAARASAPWLHARRTLALLSSQLEVIFGGNGGTMPSLYMKAHWSENVDNIRAHFLKWCGREETANLAITC